MTSRPAEVVLGDDAYERLARFIGDSGDGALLVMDRRTRAAAGKRVALLLRERELPVEECLLGGEGEPVASEETVAAVRRRLRANRWPVAIGSGSITDIVRYAAHLETRDFLSVPTAASMDGYASSVAPLMRDGVKVTYPARAPVAIFADPQVAAAAPLELTRAGVGDLLGKATSRVDWLAAHLLYGEPFSPEADARVLAPLRHVAAHAEQVMAGGEQAIGTLLHGLLESGLAMAQVGSSRPASGCEHHASHFWDLLAERGRRAHHRHGLQVGYATRLAMQVQRFAFGGGVHELQVPVAPVDPLGPQARAWLGRPTPDIVEAVMQKQQFVEARRDRWPSGRNAWRSVCERLAPALGLFDRVEFALDAAGIPRRPEELDLDEATVRVTFRHATRLRGRYTSVDFLEGQARLDDALGALVPAG